jgi:hypothetical protein
MKGTLASLNRVVRRLVEHGRRYGVVAVVDLLLDHLVYRVIGIDVQQVVWLDAAHLRLTRLDPRFTFRFLSADEVRTFAADPSNEFTATAAERAAAGRALCFAALDGQRLAAYCWYALASPDAKHVYPADVACMADGFTHPDYRGQRLHGTAKVVALQQLADRGVRKLLSLAHWTNRASLRSSARIGCIGLGRLLVISLGSRTVMITPRRARNLGVRFRPAPAPPPERMASSSVP